MRERGSARNAPAYVNAVSLRRGGGNEAIDEDCCWRRVRAGAGRRRAGAGAGADVPLDDGQSGGSPDRRSAARSSPISSRQKSGGKMQVKLFPGGVLGGDVQVLSAVQGGTIDMTSMNSGILQGQVKEFAIVDFPFLFNNAKEADAILDGPIGKQLADKLPEKGLVHLAYYDLGFRNVTEQQAADQDGGRHRRPQDPRDPVADLHRHVQRARRERGADAVPEVYTALEQKTIDGAGEPVHGDRGEQVQGGAEVPRRGRATSTTRSRCSISKKTWDTPQQGRAADPARRRRKESAVYQRKVSRDAQDAALADAEEDDGSTRSCRRPRSRRSAPS